MGTMWETTEQQRTEQNREGRVDEEGDNGVDKGAEVVSTGEVVRKKEPVVAEMGGCLWELWRIQKLLRPNGADYWSSGGRYSLRGAKILASPKDENALSAVNSSSSSPTGSPAETTLSGSPAETVRGAEIAADSATKSNAKKRYELL
jgi:hypothetical protein